MNGLKEVDLLLSPTVSVLSGHLLRPRHRSFLKGKDGKSMQTFSCVNVLML